MIIHDVQQGSDEWHSLRAGMPTASEFSSIVTSKGEESKSRSGYAITLAGELYAGKTLDQWQGSAWTERGKELEERAFAAYSFYTDRSLTRVGFVTNDTGTYGCSPDALCGDDGLVEIKCLKAENHIKAMMYHRKHGTSPPDYVQQTQGQMLIAERKWVDLCFWHPDLPMLVVRHEPINAVVYGLESGLWALIKERDEIVSMLRSA